MTKPLLETAIYWQQQNISTVPLYYRSKCPASEALIKTGFVGPDGRAVWLPLKQQLPTEQQIWQWFSNGKKYNLALVTTENLVILDFDTVENFALWYCWHAEYNPAIIDTYMVTSSRGLHLYYWVQEPFGAIKGQNLPYEVRSHGKLVTIPPSIHSTGKAYKPITAEGGILPVERIEDILTFSPLLLNSMPRGRQAMTMDPWVTRPARKKLDLSVFLEIRPTDTEGRYFLTHCPFHGHKWNFWLDTQLEIAGCYAGCGTFLFSELAEILQYDDK